ncbi:hypothetical protein GGS21DRAFT_508560 [Xylaria nigripes]|nr:hypothetical protein GGS21DRAFT_508560 [Xylaria nigripes]
MKKKKTISAMYAPAAECIPRHAYTTLVEKKHMFCVFFLLLFFFVPKYIHSIKEANRDKEITHVIPMFIQIVMIFMPNNLYTVSKVCTESP